MLELTVICLALVVLNAWQVYDRRTERHEVRAERAGLLQRIQAPAAAVIAHQLMDAPPDPRAPSFDDDAEFWESKDLTKEQLADALPY
jgi:hypothetical protein